MLRARKKNKAVKARSAQAGFTLLETLIAFLVLAISASLFYEAWGVAAQSLSRTQNKRQGVMVASSVLDRIGTRDLPLQPGEYVSQEGAALPWRVIVTPYSAAAPSRDGQLYRIDIVVYGPPPGNIELARAATVRLGYPGS